MKRLGMLVTLAVALVALPACSGSSNASGGGRTILTDYNYDQFATSYMAYFPRITRVHPGQTVVFKQAWTGEPHTVTFGTLLKPIDDIVRPYLTGAKQPPPGEPPGLEAAASAIPQLFGQTGANQTAAEPCYLDNGSLPNGEKPCPKRPQPAFTGREAFFNSGFIPYEGNNGNSFKMRLSSTIAPGLYYYYCLMHGPAMGGYLDVKPASVAIPSQTEVNRSARAELDAVTKELTAADKDGLAKKWDLPPGSPHIDVLAGVSTPEDSLTFGNVNEYFPHTFTVRVGQKVTWLINGHSVSFHVPKYGPQFTVNTRTGFVKLNDQAYNAVGIDIPETQGDAPPPPVDGGSYNGSKFLSTGPQFGLVFSLTFTKPGTYQYACTIHPRQIGKIIVTG